MSAKSTLQILAAKQGKDQPIYETYWEGPDHKPRFFSTCFYDGHIANNSVPEKTRRAAEMAAARQLLSDASFQVVPKQKKLAISKPALSLRKICLVDLDNYDVPPRLLQSSEVSFLLFHAKTCTKKTAVYKTSANCLIFIAPCVGKDATDIYMTYEAYGIVQSFPRAEIAVVTRDHFGAILANLMKATHICNNTEFVAWLDK